MKSWISKFLQLFNSQPSIELLVKEAVIENPVLKGMKRLDYSNGGWSETHYDFGKQHDLQTFYHSNGQKKWERNFEKGVQVGIEQFWDERGTLIKECSYSFGVMHGEQKERFDEKNNWKRSIFEFGMPLGLLQKVKNPEFARLIKPYFTEKPIANRKEASDTLKEMVLYTCKITKGDAINSLPTKAKSMWGHVNIIGENEIWPTRNGIPLAPVLQIKCSDIPEFDHHLNKFSWVTLFADKDKEFTTIDEMFVLRTYGKNTKTIEITPPRTENVVSSANLNFMSLAQSFPDRNDLPPNLSAFHEQMDIHQADDEIALSSRIGGWPSWLQFTSIATFGTFLFQIDSLDLDKFDYGDSSILYFFADSNVKGYQCHSDML